MKLQISIIKHRGNPPSYQEKHLFDQEGGNIGRSKENTWRLADERKFLSRVQASVIFQNEKFYLIDKSSNGCFINQSNTPIGKGSSQELKNNDIIRMGEYELQVNFVESSAVDDGDSSYDLFSPNHSTSSPSFPSNSISETAIAADDPFADVFRPKYENEDNYVKPTVDSSFDSSTPIDLPPLVKNTTTTVNPKTNTAVKVNPMKAASPPPFPSELAQTKDSNPINSSFNTSKKDEGQNDPFATSNKDKPTTAKEEGGFTQIFGGKGILKGNSQSSPFESKQSDDIFAINNKKDSFWEEESFESSQEIKTDAEHHIENDIFRKPSLSEEKSSSSKQEEIFPPNVEEKSLQDKNTSTPFENKQSDDIFGIDNSNYNNNNNVKTISNDPPKREEIDRSDNSPAIKAPPLPVKEEKIESSAKENLLFEELFKAAGIDTQRFKVEATKEAARLIGQVLQASLQGTMDLLRSRAETKDVFRVGDKTIISIARNNPLKFLPTTEHVITQLILSDDYHQAYTPLAEAIEESFDDLKAHQFALSMSIQEALSSTIKDYFSPKNLQQKLEKSGSIGVMPWQKKANLWKLFEEAYDGIEEEASEQFQLVLERKIADAYEFHMRQIKQQRS